jgi:hypothetical protein
MSVFEVHEERPAICIAAVVTTESIHAIAEELPKHWTCETAVIYPSGSGSPVLTINYVDAGGEQKLTAEVSDVVLMRRFGALEVVSHWAFGSSPAFADQWRKCDPASVGLKAYGGVG